jgi:hypothetical protein
MTKHNIVLQNWYEKHVGRSFDIPNQGDSCGNTQNGMGESENWLRVRENNCTVMAWS